jgi:hypothetical protein
MEHHARVQANDLHRLVIILGRTTSVRENLGYVLPSRRLDGPHHILDMAKGTELWGRETGEVGQWLNLSG